MRVLVTGAAGFLGMALVQRLLAAKHDVTAVVRSKSSKHSLQSFPISITISDLDDGGGLPSGEFDTVFHLASERTETQGTQRYADTDTKVAESLCRSYPGAHFIYASSIWVYGSSQEWLVESSPLQPKSGIGRVKAQVEKVLASQKRHTIFRIGMIYPGGAFGRQFLSPARRVLSFRPSPGTNYTGLIAVGDAIEALAVAMERQVRGTFNLVDDYPLLWKEVFAMISHIHNRKLTIPAPRWLVTLTMGKDISEFVSANLKISNTKVKQAGFRLRFPDFESGIKNYIKTEDRVRK